MISVFSLYELFSASICASNTGSLVHSLSGVSTLTSAPSFTFSLSHSSVSMGSKSAISSFSSPFSVLLSDSSSKKHSYIHNLQDLNS